MSDFEPTLELMKKYHIGPHHCGDCRHFVTACMSGNGTRYGVSGSCWNKESGRRLVDCDDFCRLYEPLERDAE